LWSIEGNSLLPSGSTLLKPKTYTTQFSSLSYLVGAKKLNSKLSNLVDILVVVSFRKINERNNFFFFIVLK